MRQYTAGTTRYSNTCVSVQVFVYQKYSYKLHIRHRNDFHFVTPYYILIECGRLKNIYMFCINLLEKHFLILLHFTFYFVGCAVKDRYFSSSLLTFFFLILSFFDHIIVRSLSFIWSSFCFQIESIEIFGSLHFKPLFVCIFQFCLCIFYFSHPQFP